VQANSDEVVSLDTTGAVESVSGGQWSNDAAFQPQVHRIATEDPLDSTRNHAGEVEVAARDETAPLENASYLHDDLGEDMSVHSMAGADAKHERVQKVEAQAWSGMKTVIKLHQGDISNAKGIFKEKIAKANKIRMDGEKRARMWLSNAKLGWKSEWEKSMMVTTRKWMTLRQRAVDMLKSIETKAENTKRKRTKFWMSQTGEWRSSITSLKASQRQAYLLQLAMFDKASNALITKARTAYTKESARFRLLQKARRSKLTSDIQSMRLKFDGLISRSRARKKRMVLKLRKVEEDAIRAAKSQIAKAKAQEKKSTALAHDQGKAAISKAQVLLGQARSRKASMTSRTSIMTKFRLTYKMQLAKLKRAEESQVRQVRRAKAKKLGEVLKREVKVKKKGQTKLKTAAKKAVSKHSTRKKKQLAWLQKAKRNSERNCDDAHKAAEMKARAARYAALRVSNDAQTGKMTAYNHWKDAADKARELRRKRDKQAQNLKKTTIAAAVAMAKQLYAPKKDSGSKVPCAEADNVDSYVATPAKIPDQHALDKMSQGFAKASIPVDQAETQVKKRDILRTKGREAAHKKTFVWANNHAIAIGKKERAAAEKICAKARAWFEGIQVNVRRRLGETDTASDKAKKKVEATVKKQTDEKSNKLLAQKKTIRAKEATAVKAAHKAIAQKVSGLKMTADVKISGWKKEITKYSGEYRKFKSQGELQLKLAKEKTASKIQEAKKLASVSLGEAKQRRNRVAATTKANTLKINADTSKTIRGFKGRARVDITKLREVGSASIASISSMLKQSSKTQDMLISQAKKQYKSRAALALSKSKEKTFAAVSIVERKISKGKLKLKQELEAADKSVVKAKGAEKKALSRIDALKAEAKVNKKKSKTAFLASANDKYKAMVRTARSKQHELVQKAKIKFENAVVSSTKRRLPSITAQKKRSTAALG
jgi:hypothetical protein